MVRQAVKHTTRGVEEPGGKREARGGEERQERGARETRVAPVKGKEEAVKGMEEGSNLALKGERKGKGGEREGRGSLREKIIKLFAVLIERENSVLVKCNAAMQRSEQETTGN